MPDHDNVKNNSDSLIDLLTAQCTDLEKLLTLAREETAAAQQGKFFRILDIVTERAKITNKLETFQQQIAELRGCLGSANESLVQRSAIERVVELANMTIAQDNQTRLLLTTARDDSAQSIRNVDRSAQSVNAYQRDDRKGLAYSRDF